jgi:hypothetical protein
VRQPEKVNSNQFIESTMRQHFAPVIGREFRRIAIKIFSRIDLDTKTVNAVLQVDRLREEKSNGTIRRLNPDQYFETRGLR